jgi:hypothetical protein
MGKIKFLGLLAALFAVSISLTSCNRSDDPVGKDKVTDIKTPKSSVLATSNVSAKYSIDAAATSDFAADGKKAIFRDIESSSVKITAEYTGADADKYVNAKQTATVNFSSKPYGVPIDFVFVEKSVPVAQAVAIGGAPVVNKDQAVTVASITVPEGTTVSGSTEGFAITAYKTPANILADIAKGDKVKAGGYVLSCQPDGAKFDKPVTLKVFVGEGLAGLPLTLESGNESVEGKVDADGTVSFKVSHFSDWILKLPLKTLSEPTSFSDLIPPIQTINAVSGENKFSYTKKIGFDVDLVQGNAKAFQFICDVLQSIYGDFNSSLTEEASFTVDGAGIANVSVFQNKSKVTMCDLDDMFIFDVTRYEGVDYQIMINGVAHSGGSGK